MFWIISVNFRLVKYDVIYPDVFCFSLFYVDVFGIETMFWIISVNFRLVKYDVIYPDFIYFMLMYVE